MRKWEIEWHEHIPSPNEFTPDSSWSAYTARKNDTEIAQCVNSILPLLRQSIATYSIQKHCNEVAKNANDALNLSQVTVDTSHQLAYALSRQLQQMFPDSLGPGRYLPMFGGVHIEKILLEIHGKLITGSGISQFLDQGFYYWSWNCSGQCIPNY